MSTDFLDANLDPSGKLDRYELKAGENKFRLFGGVAQRYIYWAKSFDGKKNLSIECLAFDRQQGKWLRKERDVYQEFFPHRLDENGEPILDKNGEPERPRCSWGYAMLCFDLNEGTPEDPKPKVFYLKKKMFEQIQNLGKKRLGDPTDPNKGWDVTVEKRKTGPLPINVEYVVDAFACQDGVRPLTEAELDCIENTPAIDELLPRQTEEEQEAFIRKNILGEGQEAEDNVDTEAAEDLS